MSALPLVSDVDLLCNCQNVIHWRSSAISGARNWLPDLEMFPLDLEEDRILVRDMKHPGDKKGNHVYCELPAEALAIIKSMPPAGERIFPYSTDAISAAFTRACRILGIEDLRFHDLRHEGISHLFEMGKTIPQVAAVSGHRSWTSLKRYT